MARTLTYDAAGRLRQVDTTYPGFGSDTLVSGYDDANPEKTERLLRKAIEQAGFPGTLARSAVLEWRRVGFRAGLDLATRYIQPAYLKGYPRLQRIGLNRVNRKSGRGCFRVVRSCWG